MTGSYVELHAKSFYSFGLARPTSTSCWPRGGARRPDPCAHDTNLCGALEFARLADSLGVRPITGGELTPTDGARIVLLAKTRAGYAQPLAPLQPRQRRRPPRAPAGPGAPARARRGARPAHRRA